MFVPFNRQLELSLTITPEMTPAQVRAILARAVDQIADRWSEHDGCWDDLRDPENLDAVAGHWQLAPEEGAKDSVLDDIEVEDVSASPLVTALSGHPAVLAQVRIAGTLHTVSLVTELRVVGGTAYTLLDVWGEHHRCWFPTCPEAVENWDADSRAEFLANVVAAVETAWKEQD